MTLSAKTSSLPAYALLTLSAALALGGCTTYMTPASNSAAAAAAAPGGGASAPFTAVANARPDPAAPKPFDEIVKGATRQDGYLPVWRKDEKVWLEIPPALLDKPMLFSVNVSHSVGEKGLFASRMGPTWLVKFRKIGAAQIQLVAINTDFASDNAQMKTVLEQSYSPSLLGSSAIVSAPHPERKSVLIDATFLLSDIAGYSTALEAAFRLPLGLDRGNSFFESTNVTGDLTAIGASLHYATPRLPAPPAVPTPIVPTPPTTTPDPRSLFVGFVYNFVKLPDEPMRPRSTDPRLGYFSDDFTDLSRDLQPNPRQHYIKRWRLEKSDPSAEVSDVKQPIVYWLDKNIPLEYRDAVKAGVLEWNKAFEKIGLRNALVVKQQPDDADWDNMDARHASIRWFSAADLGGGLAVGPSQSDPRTGEIFDADIIVSESFARVARRLIAEDAPPTSAPQPPSPAIALRGHDDEFCAVADGSAQELDFALDVMEARGDIEPGSPEAEAYVQEVIKSTIIHEVGHTLGLKHNFKGSTIYTSAQLKDKAFTDKNGVSGSIMDYNAVNLPLDGERPTTLTQGQIGPYDYWAIEYAYKPIAPENEKAELAKIASRSTEPQLAYADDTEAGGIPGNDGIDPRVNRFDLGDDPLAYYQKRLQLSRELWQRVQDRGPRPGDDPLRQRRSLLAGFAQLRNAADLVGKYVGGMYTVRDIPGTTRRSSFTPVDPGKQRDALQFLARGLFNANSFRFRPEFLSDLTPDFNEWDRGGLVDIPSAVLRVQSTALDRLMSPGTASRLLNLPYYVDPAKRNGVASISLADVYGTLQTSIWSELKTGSEIDRLRRNLQRNYLSRVQNLLIHGQGSLPPDALSLIRMSATDLQADLRRAGDNPRLSIETRAHLQDSLAQLTEALRASMLRS